MTSPERIAPRTLTGLGAANDRRVVLRAMRAGLWIWPTFILLDAWMCFVAFPGAPFGLFVAYRVGVEFMFLAVYTAAARESSDLRRLFGWQSLTYIAAALAIALMAIHLGGIESPYMHGISIVALVWAALVPASWRRSLPTFVGIGLSFPIVMGAYVSIFPEVRDRVAADSLVVFASNYVFVLASAMLGLLLSHMVWNAQQMARSLGSYELEECLGQGGMGEVWRARHRLLARPAAVKLIRSTILEGDPDTRQTAVVRRFKREAEVVASLRSPHTIELFDFGVADNGAFYIAMELLEGLDSQAMVERFGPVPSERAIYLMRQICHSLSEAHGRGLVHRDIKPANIFVCQYGDEADFVKVLDFGIVKNLAESAETAALTVDGAVQGTPAFMAPEQALGHELDGRCDIYATGCVGYWLLTGETPFTADSAVAHLMHHVQTDPGPVSSRTELRVPAELDDLLMSCLAKDPDRRPQSARDLAHALEAIPVPIPWSGDRAREWWSLRFEGAGSSA